MKKLGAAIACALFATGLSLTALPRQTEDRAALPAEKLVNALRILNTAEYRYRDKNGKFADLESLLALVREDSSLRRSPVDLQNPQPYEIAVTTTQDGKHYQMIFKRPFDRNDKTTWCKTAVFSDDSGLIFLGQAIGCRDTSK